MREKFWTGAVLAMLLGCSSQDADTSGAGGHGGAPAAGSGGTSGNGGSGGTSSGGGGAGGQNLPTGGTAGASAGSSGAGGLATGGSSGAAGGGSGGMSGGGSGGTGGGGGTPADPSAGCGETGSPTGTRDAPLTVAGHQYYVKLPAGYDENTPYRLLFVFHPSGNPITWAEDNAGFPQTDAANDAIIVYPKSAGNGWEKVDIDMFDPLYDSLTNDFCIDKARVFATGESSGGDYSSVLGCERATKVRAVGPTAAKPMAGVGLNPDTRTCTGQSAAYVIHGKNDSVVGAQAGIDTRDFHLAKNNCGTTTTPVQGYTDNLSNCVEYQDCDEGYPVFWCQHEDPNYSNTNHGWPAFAAEFLWEQFSKY